MRTDPGEIAGEVRDLLDRLRPDESFRGTADGVRVTVDSNGGITGLDFVEAVVRVTHSDDLGRAVVAAHTRARAAAAAACQRALDGALSGRGIEARWEKT